MTDEGPTRLVHVEDTTGFAVAHVADEISTYETFVEIVCRDQRIPRNYDPERMWLPMLEHTSDKKLGVAKNNVLAGEWGGQIRASKFYDWAFQGRDKRHKTFISGLYRLHRPMFAFEGDYAVFSESPFVVFAFGVDVTPRALEATVDEFFDRTGLTARALSAKDVADFEARKGDIVWSINEIRKKLPDFRRFNANFGYELMQGNRLYDRFVSGADFGM